METDLSLKCGSYSIFNAVADSAAARQQKQNSFLKRKPHRTIKKFLSDYQVDIKYLKNFIRKTLSVSEKAVFLQPQIARFSVDKIDEFCDIVQPP